MTELLIVGMFAAFCLAVLKPLTTFLSVFSNGLLVNALFSLVVSSIAVYLLVPGDLPGLAVWAIAGAFFGSFLLALAERISSYRPAIINPTRPE